MVAKLLLRIGSLVVAGYAWLVVLQPAAAQTLNLAPKPGTYVGEGTPFPCIRFTDAGVPVRFMPPDGWRFEAKGAACSFAPTGVSQANGLMSVVTKEEANPPNPEERAVAMLQAQIPGEASDVKVQTKDLPQVNLDRWKAYRVQATYSLFGQSFRVAFVLVPRENDDVQIVFTARASDFERVYEPFFESLGTFTWDPPEEKSAGAPPKR
jgi:hypothetical protein